MAGPHTKAQMLAEIAANITTNGLGAISGQVLRTVLNDMVSSYAQGELSAQTITFGDVLVAVTDGLIILNKSLANPTALTLPDIAGRQDQLPLYVVDFTGLAGDMVFTPAAGQTIMSLGTWTVGSGGVAGTGGHIAMMNVAAVNGWVILG